jgi:hypothetical protein
MSENTNASQGLEYHFDIVFCIDVSIKTSVEIESVKEFVLHLPTELIRLHEWKGKRLGNLRVRFILFPDVSGNHSHEFSHFLSLNSDGGSKRFQTFVQSLRLTKQQSDTEKSLHALFNALRSNWTQLGERQRHVVIMITNLGHLNKVGDLTSSEHRNSHEIDALLNEMTDYWHGATPKPGTRKAKLNQVAQRLILLAPDMYPWPTIGDSWAQSLFLPSQAGEGLSEVELQTIVDALSNDV